MEDRITLESFVLAGGKSSRMGTDKGLMDFQGWKMIQHILYALNFPFPKSIISNNEEYRQFGLPVIPDIYKNCGPLGAIHSGLYHAKSFWSLMVSCDMPFMTYDFLVFLMAKSIKVRCDALVPVHDGNVEPLCAMYSHSAMKKIEMLISEKKLKMLDVLEELNTHYVGVPLNKFDTETIFRNINSPTDILPTDIKNKIFLPSSYPLFS
jgi:molybdopterin-guanine dinucleotide biosynthesis protein A